MTKRVKIKAKIEVSKSEIKNFDKNSATINLAGSTLTPTESPNPAADKKRTFWYEVSNIDPSVRYTGLELSAVGLRSTVKIEPFCINDQIAEREQQKNLAAVTKEKEVVKEHEEVFEKEPTVFEEQDSRSETELEWALRGIRERAERSHKYYEDRGRNIK